MDTRNLKKCEICNTRSLEKKYILARFPMDEDRCKKWVKATGNKNLARLTVAKLHYSHYVCGKHFSINNFQPKQNRLKRTAVPTLHLPYPALDDTFLENFPNIKKPFMIRNNTVIHKVTKILDCGIATAYNHSDHSIDGNIIINEHNYCLPYNGSTCTEMLHVDTVICDDKRKYCDERATMPQTRREGYNSSFASVVDISVNENCKKKKISVTPGPTSSSFELDSVPHSSNVEIIYPGPTSSSFELDSVPHSSNVEIIYPGPTSASFELDSVPHSSNIEIIYPDKKQEAVVMTPRQKNLLKNLKQTKEKLKAAQKKLKAIDKIKSPLLKSLIESEISNQKKKPNGKRWSKFTKCVALAIYKKSPKAYRYLSQMLALPSIRTVRNVIQEIKLMPGIIT